MTARSGAATVVIFCGLSASILAQAPSQATQPNTPARLKVCNGLADGRGLQGTSREEYLSDCFNLPMLAAPAPSAAPEPRQPRPERPSARATAPAPRERESAPAARPAPEPSTPAPSRAPVQAAPSSAAPITAAASVVTGARPGVSKTTRGVALVVALLALLVSAGMVRLGTNRFAAVVTAAGLVAALAITAGAVGVWTTVLRPSWVVNELSESKLVDQLPAALGDGMPPPMVTAFSATIAQERPYLFMQIRALADSLYGYIDGESADVALTFQTGTIRGALEQHLVPAMIAIAPPGTPQPEINQAVQRTIDEMLHEVEQTQANPVHLADLPEDARSYLGDARATRPYVVWWLVGGLLLSAQLMVLLWLVGSSRWTGIASTVGSALILTSTLFLDRVANWAALRYHDQLPAPVQAYIPTLTTHLWGGVRQFAIAVLIVGLVALAISVVRPRRVLVSGAAV